MKYLIVGLGNVGPEYEKTRHNIGFRVVDALAKYANVFFCENRYGATVELKLKGNTLILLKPSTFMNLSGSAVRYWMQKEKIQLENLLIVVDDLALPLGKLRMKGKGSDAGHNGLKNIQELLSTDAYARLRFGIGNDFAKGKQVDYVIGEFTDEENAILEEKIPIAVDMIKSFCLAGLNNTMNAFNNK